MKPLTSTAGFCAPVFRAAPYARGLPEVVSRLRRRAGEGEETGRDRPSQLLLAGPVRTGAYLAFVGLPVGGPKGGRTGPD